jgi:hypothetical protein
MKHKGGRAGSFYLFGSFANMHAQISMGAVFVCSGSGSQIQG